MALSHVEGLHNRVRELKARGFRVAIDDLGSGYASLSSLLDVEPDVVKLDGALIRGISESPGKRQIVRSIAKLCTEMGIPTVAEHVGNADRFRSPARAWVHLFSRLLLRQTTTLEGE